ncbi:MAG: phosphatidate cytidylyltransferase [Candidatus Heritagella sp.]
MKQRIISGAVIVLFAAAIVLFNQSFPVALNIAIALISGCAIWELIAALGIQKKLFLVWPSLAAAVVIPFTSYMGCDAGLILYIYTLILFCGLLFHHKEVTFRELGMIYSMTLLIPAALGSLVGIRDQNPACGIFTVMIAVFAAWIADAGAYFVGSFFGKTKLCPEISPKKTVEGAIGGMVVNMLVLVLIGWIYELLFPVDVNYISMLLIGFGSSVISILGDLSFSLIKRSCNIKDFGQVIPGHGGILDRFDSVIFVSPLVYYICLWLPLAVK